MTAATTFHISQEETPFFGGKFRMKLVLSEDFPASPPKGFFLTKIYHPNVALNGRITSLNSLTVSR